MNLLELAMWNKGIMGTTSLAIDTGFQARRDGTNPRGVIMNEPVG